VSYGALADLVVTLHLAFVLFVGLGGLLVLRWRWVAWLHVPAAVWGVWIEFSGRICPLTPLENQYRQLGGAAGYEGGFIAHYILPALYPHGLTRTAQVVLGVAVAAFNVWLYIRAFGPPARASAHSSAEVE
jgi:hypothetical protein